MDPDATVLFFLTPVTPNKIERFGTYSQPSL